jgi:hypothetical protein
VVRRFLNVSATWREKWVLDRQNKGSGRFEKVPAQGEELHPWIKEFTRHEEGINAYDEIKLILADNGLHESMHDLNVRQVATTSARTLNERFTRLKGDNLETSLTEVAGQVTRSTSDLKDARARRELKRANQGAPKRGDVVPELLKDRSLHQLRTQGADILDIL